MVYVHDCALALRDEVNNIVGSQHWSVTVTVRVQLTSPRLVVWMSVDNTHGLHAYCAMVAPSATMHVQNCAGSRMKRGSC